MSAELIWSCVKNNNCFLVKRNGVQFSREASNLANINSFKFSGIANPKAVGIIATEKGAQLVTKVSKKARNPAKLIRKVGLSSQYKKGVATITAELEKKNYRRDLQQAALAKWSKVRKSLNKGPAAAEN
mmetsp:Transcript_7373/g.19126  ORF Transcript_7373/g.19126 Transcript_7373/m.19126 type:complete len:129 (+) Transcript_7373:21-407(+)|eukprot:CAMPEP_0113879124 /NCGR_PEP_ID=MMETSP0780_2-20120614/7062_1 /TAXON_ID=652834 /ORGANISM="Palpitomonas bilix" /LENGTH=128 /DNA_ID=CAMNT_0000865667 /DNA_START=118 /DNA_END=504 /DNA_ORIENTATION=+ /assembly_acc=CAM_ASM_000599